MHNNCDDTVCNMDITPCEILFILACTDFAQLARNSKNEKVSGKDRY